MRPPLCGQRLRQGCLAAPAVLEFAVEAQEPRHPSRLWLCPSHLRMTDQRGRENDAVASVKNLHVEIDAPLLARTRVTATRRASFALYNTKDEVESWPSPWPRQGSFA